MTATYTITEYGTYRVAFDDMPAYTGLDFVKTEQEAIDACARINKVVAFAAEHAHPIGTIVIVGANQYRITDHRFNDPRGLAYSTQGLRNGKNYGPSRVALHTKVKPVAAL